MYPSPEEAPPSTYANIPPVAEPPVPQAPLSADYGNIPHFAAMPNAPARDGNRTEDLDAAIGAVEAEPLGPTQEPQSLGETERSERPGYLPDYKPRNAPPRAPLGPLPAFKADSITGLGATLPAYDPKNAPKSPPIARIPPLPKSAPPVRREPGANEIVIEKPQSFKENERSVSTLPDRVTFKGHITAKRADGGLILTNADRASAGELIHLPASATAQLNNSKNGGVMIRESMQNGADGAPLQISHFKGKWSVAPTNNHALRK
jgi:hypothetical protein